jgi:hypothetical protein
VGLRTGRIAVSLALFNMLVLIARTANGFQAPLLAKKVESDIVRGVTGDVSMFRWIIFSCTLSTIMGALMMPRFQKVLSKAVLQFSHHQSMWRLFVQASSKLGIRSLTNGFAWPWKHLMFSNTLEHPFPLKIFIINTVAIAFVTVGVLSAVYASYLNPDFRNTAGSLSALVNGISTILMFIFVDPHFSVMTDDVALGKRSESSFKSYIAYMIIARVFGTVLAQLIFLPTAALLAKLAGWV